ncbi:MAG: hypothetical protein WBB01_26770 [Phormidesmis sp.]
MVLFRRGQGLLSALGLAPANADRPDKCLIGRVVSCSGLLSSLLSLAIGLSAQASAVSADVDTAAFLAHAALPQKGASIDKSTLRFEQTQFEQRRLEAALLRQRRLEQARIEHLRRLQAHLGSARHWEQASLPATASNRSVDGIYLYGQQPIPDQLATAYFVFELQDGNITGAFYMPSSSFDCVRGQMESDQILLSVTDSYSQETSPYALSLNPPAAVVASQLSPGIAPPNISGFYRLPMNDQGRELLTICQARY